jgi:alanine dehydrogenase
VIGGGVAGEHAAANALGLGADVTTIDISLPKLRQLEARFEGAVQTRASTRYQIADQLLGADLVIGSVLIPGAAAPKLVTDDMVAGMKHGSVLVDIARPGRLLRRVASDHARRADIRGTRLALLQRREHARCGSEHLDARPRQRDAALRGAIANRGWDAAAEADPALAGG